MLPVNDSKRESPAGAAFVPLFDSMLTLAKAEKEAIEKGDAGALHLVGKKKQALILEINRLGEPAPAVSANDNGDYEKIRRKISQIIDLQEMNRRLLEAKARETKEELKQLRDHKQARSVYQNSFSSDDSGPGGVA